MPSSSDELTESQHEKLVQFQDITGYEDLAHCRDILHAHSWNLETAVSTVLQLPSTYRATASLRADSQEPNSSSHVPETENSAIQSWTFRKIFEFGWYVLQWPIWFSLQSLYNILRFAFSLIRVDPRLAVSDPEGNVRKFVKEFREQYGRGPDFLESSYNQALLRAKADLRFLLVYLHSSSHEDTDVFCREILCAPSVVGWLSQNMLVWGCSVQLPEGYRVSLSLRERTYPFFCVIVLREHRMTVVARIQGQVTSPEHFTSILSTIKTDNEGVLRAARMERNERSLNQTLRQQQDEAYLESLRADQEKARKRLEEERRLKKAEEDAARAAELRRLEKCQLASQVPEEPARDHPVAIQLALRFPSGLRIDRRFLQDQSMKYLYYYVLCHDDAPDNFEIYTTYPRRKLPCQPKPGSSDDPPTFRDFGLARNESLMVTDLDA